MFDDDTKIAVNRELVTGMDKRGGVGNSGNTGEAVFPGDNGAVNEHATPALHDSRGQRHNKGHVGVNGVADKNFSSFKVEQV